VLCFAVLCCAVLCCAVLCCTVLFCAVLCCAVLYCTVLCCAVLCCTVLCCTVLYCAVLCCAVLCCTVLCCACADYIQLGLLDPILLDAKGLLEGLGQKPAGKNGLDLSVRGWGGRGGGGGGGPLERCAHCPLYTRLSRWLNCPAPTARRQGWSPLCAGLSRRPDRALP
jgi:hypothetical protein